MLSLFGRKRKTSSQTLVDRASQLAEEGRKLVLFDAETGLFAPWYIAMRCTEECYRAVRYKRPLTLLLIEPPPGQELEKVRADVTEWLITHKRRSDIAGYLGNGSFAMLMPETDVRGAAIVTSRLVASFVGLKTGISSYPDGGGNYEQLLAAASRALGEPFEDAA